MSEHYDFHYHPTGSGAISGQQVLEQTEDAINELGDYVNDNVGGAMDVAQQALETAQTANTNAQTALDTANSFSGAIQSAQQDASTALSTAQTAQTTASNANNTAIQASQDASSAVTTANNASGQVSTLSGTVTALGQRVTTAEGNIGQNTSDITALTTRVGTAEGNITTLQNDVSIAQGNASSAMATAGTVKQQSYVLRYSSSSVTDNSTIAYSTLDNTDNIKSGDKVIDVDGKIFSVVSVDTANSTVTVGAALIDLALDSNVVHTNKNDNVSIPLNSTSADLGVTGGYTDVTFLDKNNKKLSGLTLGNYASSKLSYARLNIFDKDTNNNEIQDILEYAYVSNNNNAYFRVGRDNFCTLGSSSYRWKAVYSTNYYYGNDNVEFSTKFVTTDTTQTISGAKTFSSNINVYNSDSTGNVSNLVLKNSIAERGVATNTQQTIHFTDKNDASLGFINCGVTDSAVTQIVFKAYDANNQSDGFSLRKTATATYIQPTTDNATNLGTNTAKWSNVATSKINSLEPSSLSLPSGNANDVIDISSYITALNGTSISYTVPANGWISIAVIGTAIAIVSSSWSDSRLRESSGNVRMLYPVLKNKTLNISVIGTTLAYARFIPCQGNV